ncbi:transcriptional coactivator/pterin dehydratase [Cantharellus anzutake]|uniref:transcriptional coactivator/pterin dehydratase n=1 Tax=Cantharellus anzutake TaxID=1750568 RepID=UPI001903B7CB|nr:transcriptional coactivator/pterin dehydratase [Cantharellus anzutake]KAF8335841.1 transcriptional coactivator/pterin dehydratase [Cantharellus anzutake]
MLLGWGTTTTERGSRSLRKEFRFRNFNEAWAFLTMIAMKATQVNHHPKITNLSASVRISLSTHDSGNTITEKDASLARYIDYVSKMFQLRDRPPRRAPF